jgi:hypothetical protein
MCERLITEMLFCSNIFPNNFEGLKEIKFLNDFVEMKKCQKNVFDDQMLSVKFNKIDC